MAACACLQHDHTSPPSRSLLLASSRFPSPPCRPASRRCRASALWALQSALRQEPQPVAVPAWASALPCFRWVQPESRRLAAGGGVRAHQLEAAAPLASQASHQLLPRGMQERAFNPGWCCPGLCQSAETLVGRPCVQACVCLCPLPCVPPCSPSCLHPPGRLPPCLCCTARVCIETPS